MSTNAHYAAAASIYETAWCYKHDGEFQQWMAKRVQAHLPDRCGSIADVGAGTGSFTHLLQEVTKVPSLCVEPSPEMAAKAEERGMDVIVSDALAWAENGGSDFDAVLLKEVRHHFEDPAAVYQALAKRLAPGGRIIIIGRPDESVGYPFFEAAHTSWKEGVHVPMKLHVEALEKAGLIVRVEEEKFPVSLQKADWERLLQGRFWSHLHRFSDQEIVDGLQALDLPDPVEFNDVMAFTIAELPRKVDPEWTGA